MSVRVASVEIIAKLLGDKKAKKDWRDLQRDMDRESERTFRNEERRNRERLRATVRLQRAWRDLGRTINDSFSGGRSGGMLTGLRNSMRIIRMDMEDAGARAGHRLARSAGSQLQREVFGLLRRIPGQSGARNFMKSGIIGGLIGKTVLGPLDILEAPYKLTQFMYRWLPGAAVILGIPALIKQVVDATGALVSAIPPMMLTMTAVLSKGVQDLADKTGIAESKLRGLAATARTVFDFGGKMRESVLSFSEMVDAGGTGKFDKLKSGQLSAKGEQQKAMADYMKRFVMGESGARLFDAIRDIPGDDPNARLALFLEKGVRQFMEGNAWEMKGGKRVKLSQADGEKHMRKLMTDLFGGEQAGNLMNLVRRAQDEGMSVGDLMKRDQSDAGSFWAETEKNLRLIRGEIGSLINLITNPSATLANEKSGTLLGWLKQLNEYMRETAEERAKLMPAIFGVHEGGLGKFFSWLANPTKIRTSDDAGNTYDMFQGLDGNYYKEDPRIMGLRHFREDMVKLASAGEKFVETLGNIYEWLKKLTSGNAGSGLYSFGAAVSGGFGGFFDGLVNAFEMEGAKVTDKIAEVLFRTLKGAGAKVAHRDEAWRGLGDSFRDFMIWSLDRSANLWREAGGLMDNLGEAASAAGTARPDGKSLAGSLANFLDAFATGLSEVMKRAFETLSMNNDVLEKVYEFGMSVAAKLWEGIADGLKQKAKSAVGSGLSTILAPFYQKTAGDYGGSTAAEREQSERAAVVSGARAGNHRAAEQSSMRMLDVMQRNGQLIDSAGGKISKAADKIMSAADKFAAGAGNLGKFAAGAAPYVRPSPPTGQQSPVQAP